MVTVETIRMDDVRCRKSSEPFSVSSSNSRFAGRGGLPAPSRIRSRKRFRGRSDRALADRHSVRSRTSAAAVPTYPVAAGPSDPLAPE